MSVSWAGGKGEQRERTSVWVQQAEQAVLQEAGEVTNVDS